MTCSSNQIAQAVQEQSLVTRDIHHSVLDIKRLADDSSQGSRHAVQGIIAAREATRGSGAAGAPVPAASRHPANQHRPDQRPTLLAR